MTNKDDLVWVMLSFRREQLKRLDPGSWEIFCDGHQDQQDMEQSTAYTALCKTFNEQEFSLITCSYPPSKVFTERLKWISVKTIENNITPKILPSAYRNWYSARLWGCIFEHIKLVTLRHSLIVCISLTALTAICQGYHGPRGYLWIKVFAPSHEQARMFWKQRKLPHMIRHI